MKAPALAPLSPLASRARLASRVLLVLAATFAPSLSACADRTLPPRGQLVLYVTTDAPLPAAPGDLLRDDEPRPLFDELRVEVFLPGEATPCDGCTRDFDVDRAMVDEGRASFGVVPRADTTGYRARVRLYTGRWVRGGEPTPESTLDTTVELPPVPAEGIVEATVILRTEDVARVIGREAPITASPGRPSRGLVGTWPGAVRRPCAWTADVGEVCVRGGAFWMGLSRDNDFGQGKVNVQQRLVTLAPFLLDVHEVTVAEMRASGVADADDPPRRASCYYGDRPGNEEDLPVNCASWQKAREYCASRGGDLPTEAEYEYAAGATASRRFVWGDDDPACGDAIYGRNYYSGNRTYVGVCNEYGGPQPAGAGRRDALFLPGASEPVVDLAGNLAEWTLDVWNDDPGVDSACWGTGVFQDPLCVEADLPQNASAHVVRGGSFLNGPFNLTSANRDLGDGGGLSTGFRCARAGL